MDVETAVRRWLEAYNSRKPWTHESFDDGLFDFLHLEADQSTRLDGLWALSRHPLSWEAKGFLGADLAEGILSDAPDLLPRIEEMTNDEPRLRTIIAYAWETSRMTDEAKVFLRRMQSWAALHDPEPTGRYPTEHPPAQT